MNAKDKIKILSREYVIDMLLAIHNGFDRAGKKCDPTKELRGKFSFLSYRNYRRILGLLTSANFIFGKGSVVDRQYFINYKELDINIFY